MITVPKFAISESDAVLTVLICILRNQVIALIWLRYHANVAEFGYGKYLIVLF